MSVCACQRGVGGGEARAVETAPGGGCGRHETRLRGLGRPPGGAFPDRQCARDGPNRRRAVSWRRSAPRRGFNRPPLRLGSTHTALEVSASRLRRPPGLSATPARARPAPAAPRTHRPCGGAAAPHPAARRVRPRRRPAPPLRIGRPLSRSWSIEVLCAPTCSAPARRCSTLISQLDRRGRGPRCRLRP